MCVCVNKIKNIYIPRPFYSWSTFIIKFKDKSLKSVDLGVP